MDLEILKQRARAFDHLFDAVVVTDLEGIIIDWNNGSEALYGYSKEEAIGQPVCMLHVPEDIEHITAEVIEAVGKDGKWTGEVRMLHKDGQIGWIESMCVPIMDDNEQMIGALGINRDITDRIAEAEHLNHLAHYDQLTQIPNRYLLLDRIAHLIEQAERKDNEFALLYIDLDNFKQINDTKGHVFGDRILKEVANCLKQSIRNADTVARIGGDEFVILLEDITDNNDISMIAKVLVDELHKPFTINQQDYGISGSIGIATYPTDGRTTDELLAAADKAMYKAKETGKDTFVFKGYLKSP